VELKYSFGYFGLTLFLKCNLNPPKLFFISNIALVFLFSLLFNEHFRFNSSISLLKLPGTFTGIVLNVWIHVWYHCHSHGKLLFGFCNFQCTVFIHNLLNLCISFLFFLTVINSRFSRVTIFDFCWQYAEIQLNFV
jgi:hypothetical protein